MTRRWGSEASAGGNVPTVLLTRWHTHGLPSSLRQVLLKRDYNTAAAARAATMAITANNNNINTNTTNNTTNKNNNRNGSASTAAAAAGGTQQQQQQQQMAHHPPAPRHSTPRDGGLVGTHACDAGAVLPGEQAYHLISSHRVRVKM